MKPYATYGKKPRGSKTSKREVIHGIPLFLHFSKADTSGSIIAYHDKHPYPRIAVFAGNGYWDAKEKLEAWFEKNVLDVKLKLETLDKNFGIPKDIMDKAIFNANKYRIYDTNPRLPNLALVVIETTDGFLYLRVSPSEAPMINVNNKKVPDSDKIYKEYLERLKTKVQL